MRRIVRVLVFAFHPLALGCAESHDGTGALGIGGTAGAGVGGSVNLGGSAGKLACENLLLAAESPGPDGQFGTGDDEIVHADRVHWGTEHVEWSLRTDGTGPDGEWGTEDDEGGSLSVYAWANDRLQSSTSYEAWGDDAQWNTPDDVVYAHTSFDYATPSSGTQTQSLAGADHAIGTSDDSIAQWLALGFEPDPSAGAAPDALRVTGMLYHQTPGDDTLWQTEDDPVAFAQRHAYPTADTRKIFMATAAGPDTQWLTADDTESTAIVSMCNPALGIATDKFYSPGPDGELDTPDDLLESQWYYRFDGCGESHCPTIIR